MAGYSIIVIFSGFIVCGEFSDTGFTVPYSTLHSYSEALSQIFKVSFSADDAKCLDEGSVSYETSCYKLLNQGPCPENYRLVLDKQQALSGTLVPVCRPQLCWWGYEYVKKFVKCFHLSDITNIFCPKGLWASTDVFGDTKCRCPGETSHLAGANDQTSCYDLFKPGVCPRGQILVPLNTLTTHDSAICQVDYCSQYQSGSRFSAPIIAVKWDNGSVACFERGYQGPCFNNTFYGETLRRIEILPGIFSFYCYDLSKGGQASWSEAYGGSAVDEDCIPNTEGVCVKPVRHTMQPSLELVDFW